MAGAFILQIARRQAAEVGIYQMGQLVQRAFAAILPALEPERDAFRNGRAYRSRLHRDNSINSMAGFSRGLRYMVLEKYYAQPPRSASRQTRATLGRARPD